MANMKNCPSCAADYDDTLPKCPFCGTLNLKGAEAEYMEKLEDVRSDMADLGNVPEAETKKEFAKQGKFLKRLLLILGGIVLLMTGLWIWDNWESERDLQEDYLWRQANYPIFDEMYANGEYEELVAICEQAISEDLPFFEWEHAAFCEVLEDLFHVDMILDKEAEEGSLPTYYYEDLLYYGWKMQGSYLEDRLSEEELVLIAPYTERLRADFAARWNFTEEERAAFEKEQQENYGYVSFDTCSKYIKKWKKENK